MIGQPASGVGWGSNPLAALALVVPLTVIRFVGEQIKEASMNKKQKKSKSNACVSKRRKKILALITAYFFENVWAIGASVAAAMVISTSTRSPEIILLNRAVRPAAASAFLSRRLNWLRSACHGLRVPHRGAPDGVLAADRQRLPIHPMRSLTE